MSNHITIELCAEDRARIDRLTAALERKACDKCVAAAIGYVEAAREQTANSDPVQAALAETLAKAEAQAEAPKNATEAAETSTLTTEPPKEEVATGEEPTAPPTAKTVDRADLRAKVIELSAKGLKDQTRAVVKSYAETVKDVPEDKVAECYAKLEALGG